MNKTNAFVNWVAGVATLAATGSGTAVMAKNPPDAREGPVAITLRVYDYVHANRPAILAAESEATTILAQAGVEASWVDCPTSYADWDNHPDCQSAWQVNDYALRIMPKQMANLLQKSQDTLGYAIDCDSGPYCWAGVFYDRVRNLVGGGNAPLAALLGRVMAHEIGHLLLGANSHSRTGIMRAIWFGRELSMNAGPELLFTAEQSWRIKSRLIEQTQTWQAQTRVTDIPPAMKKGRSELGGRWSW